MHKSISIFLLLCSLASVEACAANRPPPTHPRESSASSSSPLAGASLVIDVRTSEEQAQGHLPNALLLPIAELEARLPEVEAALGGNKSEKIVTYCGSGKRAARAKLMLEQHGYTNVVNGGGYNDLK